MKLNNFKKAPVPANIPEGAIGFIRNRADRPGRLAFYWTGFPGESVNEEIRHGLLETTFATGFKMDDVRRNLSRLVNEMGLTYFVDENGFVFRTLVKKVA
jgi:hypothetical protein